MSRAQPRAFATAYRCLGWIYVAALAFWLASGGYKGIPLWTTALLLAASLLLIRRAFMLGRRSAPPPRLDEEIESPID